MLSFDNVTFNYSNQELFNDINFTLESGEFSFIIGKSGAGKSTILQLIYMNVFPYSGSVQVGEYNSRIIKPRQLSKLRRKLGIIFQDFRLLSDRNIYENLSFVLQSVNTPSREIKKKVNDALSDVGLIHRRYSMPHELSGGEKQRVAIARAVVNEPMLILADEPTGNLDPDTSMEIMNILMKVNLRGTAVLFATHNYELVKKLNTKILKIENGKVFKAVIRQKESV